jgi:predicted NACHT family NTPase
VKAFGSILTARFCRVFRAKNSGYLCDARQLFPSPPIPIFERLGDLRNLQDEAQRVQKTLGPLDALFALATRRGGPELSPRLFAKLIQSGDCILLLDALDEVNSTERPLVVRLITDVADVYPELRIIVTSRIVGYEAFPLKGFSNWVLEQWSIAQVHEFVRSWVASSAAEPSDQERWRDQILAVLRASPEIDQLARNPLFLTMIAEIVSRQNVVPRRISQLIAAYENLMIEIWNHTTAVNFTGRLSPTEMRAILAELALKTMNESQAMFRERELNNEIYNVLTARRTALTGHEVDHVASYMKRMQRIDGWSWQWAAVVQKSSDSGTSGGKRTRESRRSK